MNAKELAIAIIDGKTWTFIEDEVSGGILALDQDDLIMDLDCAKFLLGGVSKFIEYHGNENIQDVNQSRWFETLRSRDLALSAIGQASNRRLDHSMGYVYFLKGTNGLTKVGMSYQSVNGRIGMFEPKLPFDTEVIHTIHCHNPVQVESNFHKRFSSKRIRGEWFELSDEDLLEIKEESYE